jgi:heptosyltransferase-1
MKILIIKLSSIGDIIHTFPAIIDAKRNINDLTIDWLIDENFEAIPSLLNYSQNNKIINQIISIPLRKTKKNIKNIKNLLFNLLKLRSQKYDLIIDAQGLLKSAIIAKYIKSNKIAGFNWSSCREPLASCFYNYKFNIERQLHAITRIRKLFSLALNYKIDIDKETYIDSGLNKQYFSKLPELVAKKIDNYIVFLHGTTWETKYWDPKYWHQLNQLLAAKNIYVVVTFSNLKEQQFVEQLAANSTNVVVLPKMNIEQIACMLANATAVVAVDTGFAHLTGALNIPIVTIYGATCTYKSAVAGNNSINLQSQYHCSPCLSKICLEYKHKRSLTKQPCLTEITPEIVFSKLSEKQNSR